MKWISFFLLLCSCTNSGDVYREYKKGNPHARDLLLHGLNRKNVECMEYFILDRALQGDDEAKQIIYAQIHASPEIEESHRRKVIIPVQYFFRI